MLLTYLIPFLVSLLLSAVLSRFVRDYAVARGWVDRPDPLRHRHSSPVPRLGGVAICLSFVVVVGAGLVLVGFVGIPFFLPARVLVGILGPALIVFLMGLYDDLHPLGAYWKFAVQTLAAVLLWLAGLGIRQVDLLVSGHSLRAAAGLPLTVLWVLLITNAFNLLDGLDGLAAGSAFFSTLVLFVASLLQGSHGVSFLAIVLAGAVLGFLRFNFHPASLFLGDSGSQLIGFMLSAVALLGSQKAPIMVAVAIPVVSFGLPIMDVAMAVVRRFLNRKSLFRADTEHIHHKLLTRGLSQREAVLVLYAVSAGFALLSLALLHGAGTMALALMVIGIGACLGIQQLRYHEFSELRRVLQRTLTQRRIIANDLSIRRATESLRGCTDMGELCRVLTDALQPMAFEGFSFQLPFAVRLPEPSPGSPIRGSNGDLHCHWALAGPSEPAWELKLELIASTGDRCGFFSVYKRCAGEPLLMDVNLLTDGFHAALADALYRTLLATHSGKRDGERLQNCRKERAASAS